MIGVTNDSRSGNGDERESNTRSKDDAVVRDQAEDLLPLPDPVSPVPFSPV